jgi:hypothetical protein
VAARTYSGSLPRKPDGDTLRIHYDPDDPATLGDRSLKRPIGFTLFMGLVTGVLTGRWITGDY